MIKVMAKIRYKRYFLVLLVLFCIPYWESVFNLLATIEDACISNTDNCKIAWRKLLWLALPRVLVCLLAIYLIAMNSKYWRTGVLLLFTISAIYMMIFEILPFLEPPKTLQELFRLKVLGFKYWIKFNDIGQSLYFLSIDYLNPVYLFLVFLLTLTDHKESK